MQFACAKTYLKIDGRKTVVKRCTISSVDTSDTCGRQKEDGVRLDVCFCHSDKCNGASGLKFSIILILVSILLYFPTKFCLN